MSVAAMKEEKKTETWREDFPALSQEMNGKPLAYLDSASSAQKSRAVLNSLQQSLALKYSNIHRGLYHFSEVKTKEFESVRTKVRDFINAPSENEIVFTRNTTEAINLVAQSWGRENFKAGDEVILSTMEHHANIVPWQILEKEIGIVLRIIPILENGTLDLEAYQNLLSERTKFISLVDISNATGIINPLNKIMELARKFNPEIKVLIDGSQSVVHRQVDLQEMDCDFFCFTGHKLYGPTGVGVLWGREALLNAMPPYQGGGDMIEHVSFGGTTFKPAPAKFEAGTPAIAEVIALGAAIDYVQTIGMENIIAYEDALYHDARREMGQIEGLTFYGDVEKKAPILSFTADWAHHSDITMILDQCGVAVRSGHHCCMPLMQHYGIDGTIRASLGLYSNRDDIDVLLEGLKKAEKMLK